MPATKFFEYASRTAAVAFYRGMEYAGGSSKEPVGVFSVPGPRGREVIGTLYFVHAIDTDLRPEHSDKAPPRWSKRKRLAI